MLLAGLVAAVLVTAPDRTADPAAGSTPPPGPSTPTDPGTSTSDATPSSTADQTGPGVVTRGNGRLVIVPVPRADRGSSARPGARVVRWTLQAEQGLGADLYRLAVVVRDTLHDRRGWEREDGVRFVHVPQWQVAAGTRVDVRVTLASPDTTDRLCAPMTTAGRVSCWHDGRAVLNSRRWLTGAPSYAGRLARYRTYLVNHEVGHGLGHGHEECAGRGSRAPVMMQQTLGLGSCWAWPYPQGDGSRIR